MKMIAVVFFITLSFVVNSFGVETNDFSSPEEYLAALEKAADKYERGEPLDVSITQLFFTPGKMRFVLSYNFAEPRVANLLKKIQKLKVSDTLLYAIPDYLSGQQKQKDMALRRANPQIAKPVPALNGGFFPADGVPKIKPDPMSAALWMNEPEATAPPSVLDVRQKRNDQSTTQMLSDGEVEKQSFEMDVRVSPSPSVSPTIQPIQGIAKSLKSTDAFHLISIAVLAVVLAVGIAFFIRYKSR